MSHEDRQTERTTITDIEHTMNSPDIELWRCPKCGQTIFTVIDEDVPDMCDYCGDMTTWERILRHHNDK